MHWALHVVYLEINSRGPHDGAEQIVPSSGEWGGVLLGLTGPLFGAFEALRYLTDKVQ